MKATPLPAHSSRERGANFYAVKEIYEAGLLEPWGAQTRVAELLGVTRQAVSLYLRAIKREEAA